MSTNDRGRDRARGLAPAPSGSTSAALRYIADERDSVGTGSKIHGNSSGDQDHAPDASDGSPKTAAATRQAVVVVSSGDSRAQLLDQVGAVTSVPSAGLADHHIDRRRTEARHDGA
jgi:hypothetical protein